MNDLVRLLFHEVADLSPAEREKVFTTRSVTQDVRSEIESLLEFDTGGEPLTRRVGRAAEDALRSAEVLQPVTCGPYRLVRLLGEGGMGCVYLAERTDGEIDQRVAIKLLQPGVTSRSWRERFQNERQFLANLNHASIARLLDAGRASDGRPYLVMEYVDGVPVDEYAQGRPLRQQLSLFLRVCEGVAHAHRHLIIHRDLKPSNILVDASGQPKLLDFGIAKLLDETGDSTQTIERLLTPNYASPEQLQGAVQTTATDVYSLGAVLYKLLTGRSPHEFKAGRSRALDVAGGRREIPAPRSVNPALPADIDAVLRTALRCEAGERYASVEAFAQDLRAFLDSRPVQARSGDAWYRARKFLRRYWMPAAAAALVIASLAGGLYIANSERLVAERRFAQLRQLSKNVFKLDSAIKELPGSVPARESLVSASLEYLQGLPFDPAKDPDLAQEVGEAYWRLAHIEGVPTDINLGEPARAEASLVKAAALLDVVVAARPQNPGALRLAVAIAQDRMILAEQDHRRSEAIAQARKAGQGADLLLQRFPFRPSQTHEISGLYGNIALAYNNMHLYENAIPYAKRAVELSRSTSSDKVRLSQGLSLLASALLYQGDLDGSLRAIREAREAAEQAVYPNATDRMLNLYGVILREGLILGGDGGVNAARPAEAVEALQAALDLTDEAARRDAKDSTSRARVGTAARELGNILRNRDPLRALAVYDLGLRRLREIPNQLKARRDLAVLLANSSYPLRALHRAREAKQRIDSAIGILKDTKDFPAERVPLDSEMYVVLLARADYEAGEGEAARARKSYEQLQEGVMAAHPEPLKDLRDAPRMSALYGRLAAVYRTTKELEKADSMAAQQRQLWQHWASKLPKNDFVRRQLETSAN